MKEFMTDDEIARRLRIIEREARARGFDKWAEELQRVAEVLDPNVPDGSQEPTPERTIRMRGAA